MQRCWKAIYRLSELRYIDVYNSFSGRFSCSQEMKVKNGLSLICHPLIRCRRNQKEQCPHCTEVCDSAFGDVIIAYVVRISQPSGSMLLSWFCGIFSDSHVQTKYHTLQLEKKVVLLSLDTWTDELHVESVLRMSYYTEYTRDGIVVYAVRIDWGVQLPLYQNTLKFSQVYGTVSVDGHTRASSIFHTI